MQQRVHFDQEFLRREVIESTLHPPGWWKYAVAFLTFVVIAGVVVYGFLMNKGIGLTGLSRPVEWGLFIASFVFWAAIAQAGILVSAMLRLTQAEWRRPVARASEVLTFFSLLVALMFPLFHPGRPWRVAYWLIPYDIARGVYPDIRSPLFWDPTSLITYLIGSAIMLYVALLPDLGAMRDYTAGWRKALYATLSLGWKGNRRQWRLQMVAGVLLSAMMLPIFVSVHSILSWDFATTASVNGWHSTIFAPYFVAGAVHSGIAIVVTLMVLMRWLWKWDAFIREEHFDALGRLQIVAAATWLGFFLLEILFGIYSGGGPEIAMRQMTMFHWPWSFIFIIFFLCVYLIPAPLWMFKRVRTNILAMFILSILVNIGMWLERILIVVPSLTDKQPLTFDWNGYAPSPIEWTMLGWSFAFVAWGILIFSRFFPLIPLSEHKEGNVIAHQFKIGRASVPAVFREEPNEG